MSVKINLRHLEKKPVRLEGELSAEELEIHGVDELVHAREPLRYDLEAERIGASVLVRGSLELELECECARCLRPFRRTIAWDGDWACELPLEGEEAVEVDNDLVDLTPLIREDILLAFPQHPLCENECSGLPSAPPRAREQPGGANHTVDGSAAWAELNKLKF
jgi:uncharacterized protein